MKGKRMRMRRLVRTCLDMMIWTCIPGNWECGLLVVAGCASLPACAYQVIVWGCGFGGR